MGAVTSAHRPPRAKTAARAAAGEPHAAPPGAGPSEDVPIPEAMPEPGFAARVPPPEPERPLPSVRRAIFYDVENASRAQHIARVIERLAVDRLGRRIDFVAVGNWKVIGQDTARLFAQHGAQLVHSAPSTGVKDWSDLRIAVTAGVWLAGARPGDLLEIVSDDRAFDAVGDVAAGLGIAFRRLSSRQLAGAPAPEAPPAAAPASTPRGERRGGRRGRRRGGGRGAAHAAAAGAATGPHAPPTAAHTAPHTAPHDELLTIASELIETSPGRSITLDGLANALKARGFSRPPGSPRLITRLRRIKELEVTRAGQITLGEGTAAGLPPEPEPVGPAEEAWAPPGDAGAAAAPRRRRRSRRGGRRRRGRGPGAPASA
ncbi:MAG: hypothetical protein A2050_05640 [Candidatus Rokubacteria bacterium GWA2_73_35]|nr:MAG: hypothetical protein A2050_05640 [Candidatus Rokubacteria bacterium GWA2_73_35]